MNKTTMISSGILALIFAFGLNFCKPQPPAEPETPPVPDKTAQVQKVLDQILEAWETGNEKKFSQAFTEEYKAKKWCEGKPPTCKGSKEAKKFFTATKANAAKKAKKIENIKELKNTLQEAPLTDGKITAKFQSGVTWVLVKKDNEWNVDDRIAPAEAPAEGQTEQAPQ